MMIISVSFISRRRVLRHSDWRGKITSQLNTHLYVFMYMAGECAPGNQLCVSFTFSFSRCLSLVLSLFLSFSLSLFLSPSFSDSLSHALLLLLTSQCELE